MKPIARSLLLFSALRAAGLLGATLAISTVQSPSAFVAAAWAAAADESPARLAFQRGEQLFSSQQYAAALAAFEEGYRQSPHPAFLFDIGHTYRAMGNPKRAAEYYRAYLKAQPDAADRPAIEAAIAQEESKAAALTPAAPAMTATAPLPATAIAPAMVAVVPSGELTAASPALAKEPMAAPAKSEGRPFYKTWWFWTATGVAVSAAAIGLGVGLSQSTTDPSREVTWR